MRLDYIIDYAQAALNDQGVHYTQTGVSNAINEGNEIVSLTTLYYERTSNDWAPGPSANGDLFLTLPADCIVPLYVRDSVTRSRIQPVKVSDLKLESSTWWKSYTTSAQGYKYYSLWNPMRPSTYGSNDVDRFAMILHPRVQSSTLQISMNYAAVPPSLVSSTDHTRIPEGHDLILGDFAVFCGLMRRRAEVQVAMGYLTRFFDGISTLNNLMRSRYPNGRDFEPQPIEQLLERITPFPRRQNDRNRTRSRNR